MAELALAVTGLALAWKGILDFGQLLSRLTDDDDRERNVLAISLESSQQLLKDWGEYWGIDRGSGRFHDLEPPRKALVTRIIFQLHDSRELAIRRLRKKYGMLTEQENTESTGFDDRLSRMVDSFIVVAKKSRRKTRWLMGDDTLIAKLVEETMQLHGNLDKLTSMSPKFLFAQFDKLPDAQSLGARLADVEDHVRRVAQQGTRVPSQKALPLTPQDVDDVDDQTLAGFSTDSIMLSRQRERVLKHIDYALHQQSDSRIPAAISQWWNNAEAGILLLELPDEAGDESSTSACVLLYHLVECHKFIYTFEAHIDTKPEQQLLDMIRSFIQSLIALRGHKPLNNIALPTNITELETQRAADISTMLQLIEVCAELVRSVLTSSKHRVLFIVDGLELSGMTDNSKLCQFVQSFASTLQAICEQNTAPPQQALLKVLLVHKGYANDLYGCVGDSSVVDLTDRGVQMTSLREELVVTLER